MDVVGNSIVVMLGAGVLASLLAMPLGLVLSKLQGRGSSILAGLLTGMMFVPLYIQAGGWNAGFGALGWWTVTQAQASQNLFSGCGLLRGFTRFMQYHGARGFWLLG